MSTIPVPTVNETLNFRPLSPSSKVYRSANPSGSFDSRWHLLRKLKIKTVIDLRGTYELNKDKQGIPFRASFTNENQSTAILNGYGPARRLFKLDMAKNMTLQALRTVHWTDLLWCLALLCMFRLHDAKVFAVQRSFLGREKALSVFYKMLLKVHQKNICLLFEILAFKNAYPVLIHCSAGKDRTGVVFALLHRLIGTDDAAVLVDYLKSNEELASIRPYMVQENETVGLNVSEFVDVHEDALVGMLTWIDETYGGVAGYLESIGVSKSTQDIVRVNVLGKGTDEE
ncbi:UNVERIFIED_CONTAM: hypothetical protein HDU68_010007 [Siphonaria sp. JEL0065]|nr:hypothetical protein HDU68_010007 [Siphonaria sp. JEL0065]